MGTMLVSDKVESKVKWLVRAEKLFLLVQLCHWGFPPTFIRKVPDEGQAILCGTRQTQGLSHCPCLLQSGSGPRPGS